MLDEGDRRCKDVSSIAWFVAPLLHCFSPYDLNRIESRMAQDTAHSRWNDTLHSPAGGILPIRGDWMLLESSYRLFAKEGGRSRFTHWSPSELSWPHDSKNSPPQLKTRQRGIAPAATGGNLQYNSSIPWSNGKQFALWNFFFWLKSWKENFFNYCLIESARKDQELDAGRVRHCLYQPSSVILKFRRAFILVLRQTTECSDLVFLQRPWNAWKIMVQLFQIMFRTWSHNFKSTLI